MLSIQQYDGKYPWYSSKHLLLHIHFSRRLGILWRMTLNTSIELQHFNLALVDFLIGFLIDLQTAQKHDKPKALKLWSRHTSRVSSGLPPTLKRDLKVLALQDAMVLTK